MNADSAVTSTNPPPLTPIAAPNEPSQELVLTETLLNLMSIHGPDALNRRSLVVEPSEDDDSFLKQYLCKLLAYLDLADLKLIKQMKKLHKRSETVVRVTTGPAFAMAMMMHSASSSSDELHERSAHGDSANENSSDTQDQCEYENREVYALYDEAWANFDKLRHVYTLEVSHFNASCLFCLVLH